MRTGGGGRFLIFYLKKAKKLAIFDIQQAKIVHEIDIPAEDVLATNFGKPAALFEKFPHKDVFITDKPGRVVGPRGGACRFLVPLHAGQDRCPYGRA